MFLRLAVMRHAKSSWTSDAVEDHGRPLAPRGIRDAPRIARRLDELGWSPDEVVCSDAERTRQTWAEMAPHLPVAGQVRFSHRLYLAGVAELRTEVALVDGAARCLLVLGHNPGWEEVVEHLSGEVIQMTTGNVVLLRREAAPWASALDADSWALVDILRPREL